MDSIVVRELTKTYRNGVRALDGVSFAVRQGEIFGLLGPNGAGKSTTVRILATLTPPDSGSAIVAGCDVLRDPNAVRHRIGYVAQASGVDKYATGCENLTLQGQLERVQPRVIGQRVAQLLELVGLSEVGDRLVSTYSGGMKRRLDIAMGLVHEPAVLYLDEPTTGLDPETRTALWRDVNRLRTEHHITVLLTTHYLEEADHLCDRVAIIDRGTVVVEGTPTALKAEIQGDTVRLELADVTDGVPELLRSLDGVLSVRADGNQVAARVTHGATAMPVLITALERAGIAVVSVTLQRPSLDDVYLHYTGHRIGEQDHTTEGDTMATGGRRQ